MRKRLYLISMIALFFVCGLFIGGSSAFAADSAEIVEIKVEDENIVLYVKGIKSELQSVEGYIASEKVDAIEHTKLSQGDTPIRTLILIDTSLSVKEAEQQHFIGLLTKLIDEKADNESFAIASYGEKLEYQCDYNTDRWELIKSLDQIEYKKQKTYLVEILYNLITEFDNSEEECFYRIIAFTDGADSNAAGVTITELFHLLQNSPYPIYAIGSEYNSNADMLKELFSISRFTNANYSSFTSESDLEEVKKVIDAIDNYTRIVVTPPLSLQDGSIKNLRLEIKASDTTYQLSRDVRMNMHINTPNEENESPDEVTGDTEPTITAEAEDTKNKESIFGDSVSEVFKKEQNIKEKEVPVIIYIFVAIAGVLLIAIIVILICIRKKSKAAVDNRSISRSEDQEEATVLITDSSRREDYRTGTQYLFGPEKKVRIKLKDISSHQIYEKYIEGIITIGRSVEKNVIAISKEPSVSGEHCKIYLKGTEVYIEDRNSSNHTFVNDSRIDEATIIKTGDTITLGRLTLAVTISRE